MSEKSVVKITTITDRKVWDKFVTSHKEANFLQSWDFYEFHRARGKNVVRRAAVDDKGKILAAYAGVVETAKRGTYLAIAGGPLIGRVDHGGKKSAEQLRGGGAELASRERDLTRAIFADIRKMGEKYNCVFVRVRPQWELSEGALGLMRELGLRPAPMYLSVEYAGILDLSRSEEEILAGASQGFRRKLRKAKKENLEITASADETAIREFCELEKKHAERQKYVAFSQDFLTKQFEAFRQNGEVLIYTARKKPGQDESEAKKAGEDKPRDEKGEILAQNFMIFYGAEASYHYGVSSEAGTRISAAPLLHLAAMQEARKRGCKRYNLWGIVGREEKTHRFYGVSEFKRSFGCEELRYTPAHDMVLRPLKYQMTRLIEGVRKRVRHV